MKRVFDILFSLSILIILTPLFLLIAAGIYLSSPGPILYRQFRLGQGGSIFSCLKFRSMYRNSEQKLEEILRLSPKLCKEWNEKQKLLDDPRVFGFGKFLRKTSLDELPQFWNVLKGELSVVGPRPYMVCQKSELGPHAPKILSIRPGVTGLWQISGRNQNSFQERILLDAQYVEKSTFSYDLQLIFKTIPALFYSHDAY